MFGLSLSNDDWLLLPLLFFTLMMAGTIHHVRKFRKARLLDPVMIFLFSYCLFVLPLPIRAYITKEIAGDVTGHLPELLPYIPWALFLSALGLPFFIWGYYSKFSGRIAQRLPRPSTGAHARAAYIMISVVSLLLLMDLARDAGGLLDFILLGYGSTASMFGKGYLAIGLPWMFVASLFLFHRFATRRKKIDLLLFVLALALVVLMEAILGARGMLLYIGLTLLLYWHTAIRPVSTKFIVILGVIFFLGMNVFGIIRSSKYADLSDVWTKTAGTYDEPEVRENLFYTLTTGEFVVPFETLPQMIKSVGREIPPQFGLTYLKMPLFWIPSAIFPNRPLPLSNWYMEKFYGGGYGLNEGRQFFFTSEGYLNFGPFGVLGTMLFWGWCLGAVHRYRELACGEPGALMLYALTVAFIFRGIAGDSVSIFVGLPEQSLSAAVLGIWITNREGLLSGAWKRSCSSPSWRKVFLAHGLGTAKR
ncbi:MAG: hypothetical protein ACRD4H_00580 [Candidatus Acidiferrales bacterium]